MTTTHQTPERSIADPLPCCGRTIADLPLGDTVTDDAIAVTCTPQPGPVWTNGTAPAADYPPAPFERTELIMDNMPRRVPCPTWCTRHEHGMSTREPHMLELLNLAVLDEELTTDVPLSVYITQELEEDARPVVHLEIGHAMYQPTGVSLSRSDRARLAAVLLTANHLTQQ